MFDAPGISRYIRRRRKVGDKWIAASGIQIDETGIAGSARIPYFVFFANWTGMRSVSSAVCLSRRRLQES